MTCYACEQIALGCYFDVLDWVVSHRITRYININQIFIDCTLRLMLEITSSCGFLLLVSTLASVLDALALTIVRSELMIIKIWVICGVLWPKKI